MLSDDGPRVAYKQCVVFLNRSELRRVRLVRNFLSSPGDVEEERAAAARAVLQFNQERVVERGMLLQLVTWEDMAPRVGPGPQQVIDAQLGRIDLFCGIMWNRFGTPTRVAASGTQEEFEAALCAWARDGRPWILFYFCDRATSFVNSAQLAQKKRVLRFREDLCEKGLVRSFNATHEFEEALYRDLALVTGTKEFTDSLA